MKFRLSILVCALAIGATAFAQKSQGPRGPKEPKERILVCHVGSEEGPNGETYDPACVPSEQNDFFCADAGKIDLISLPQNAAANHRENIAHSYNGVFDYEPAEIGASGVGSEDDDDSDFIDEGCEPPQVEERNWPCHQRFDYLSCRPWTNEACIIGLGGGTCECNWDATVFLEPFPSDLCPGSNEDEPKSSECTEDPVGMATGQGTFCQAIPCEDRVSLNQCRPDDCAENGTCSCQWDAVVEGPSGDLCPGSNEDDLCREQLPNYPRFRTSKTNLVDFTL